MSSRNVRVGTGRKDERGLKARWRPRVSLAFQCSCRDPGLRPGDSQLHHHRRRPVDVTRGVARRYHTAPSGARLHRPGRLLVCPDAACLDLGSSYLLRGRHHQGRPIVQGGDCSNARRILPCRRARRPERRVHRQRCPPKRISLIALIAARLPERTQHHWGR